MTKVSDILDGRDEVLKCEIDGGLNYYEKEDFIHKIIKVETS